MGGIFPSGILTKRRRSGFKVLEGYPTEKYLDTLVEPWRTQNVVQGKTKE
jgi:hypothetical protein